MDELLGYPKVDPHGSPIPDKNGKIEAEQYIRYIKLSDCKEGDTVTFMAVSHSSDDLLKFLNSRDLALGSKIKVKSIEPFDESMTVSYGGKKAEMLSNMVCDKLLVRPS